MKRIFVFSGLGADERIFQNFQLPGYELCFVKWIRPLANESIHNYAKRISEQINMHKPILLGVSFGGMMAIEVAKQIETDKVILISTAKTRKELPFYYRFFSIVQLHKLVPRKLLKTANPFTNWFFGVAIKPEKELLRQILDDTDGIFLKWAIDKIVNWQNTLSLPNTLHVHGTSDKLLPIRFLRPDIKIINAGHLMVLNCSPEIIKAISGFLETNGTESEIHR